MREYFVPGRVTIVGDHTDYNDGCSLAFAVDLGIHAKVSARDDDLVEVTSSAFGTWMSSETPTEPWQLMANAVIDEMPLSGITIELQSTIPSGAGLSSSAAYVGALVLCAEGQTSLWDLARTIQRCESAAGNNVGLLDQVVTLGATTEHALLIDFLDQSTVDVPIPGDISWSIVDTGIRRTLATSEYQLRRDQCRAAEEELGGWRTATLDDVELLSSDLLRARARHVLSESHRVLTAKDALRADDVQLLGNLMNESHWSLSHDFQVSTPEIDELVASIQRQPSVFGARLVGGGFGGCVIVAHSAADEIVVPRHRVINISPSNGALHRDTAFN